MLRSERYKYIHYQGLPAQLFDLEQDPQKLQDIAQDQLPLCAEFAGTLLDWYSQLNSRTTYSKQQIIQRTGAHRKRGYLFDVW